MKFQLIRIRTKTTPNFERIDLIRFHRKEHKSPAKWLKVSDNSIECGHTQKNTLHFHVRLNKCVCICHICLLFVYSSTYHQTYRVIGSDHPFVLGLSSYGPNRATQILVNAIATKMFDLVWFCRLVCSTYQSVAGAILKKLKSVGIAFCQQFNVLFLVYLSLWIGANDNDMHFCHGFLACQRRLCWVTLKYIKSSWNILKKMSFDRETIERHLSSNIFFRGNSRRVHSFN